MSWHKEPHAFPFGLCVDCNFPLIFASPSTDRPAVQTGAHFSHIKRKHRTWKQKSVPPILVWEARSIPYTALARTETTSALFHSTCPAMLRGSLCHPGAPGGSKETYSSVFLWYHGRTLRFGPWLRVEYAAVTRHTPSQREESPRHFFHMPLSGSPQISCIPVTSRQQPRGPHPSCAVAGGSLGCWGESRGGTREDWAAVGRSFLYLHEVCLERAGGQGLRWSVQVRFVFATSCSEPAHPYSPKAPL